jgi:hypothetical protein
VQLDDQRFYTLAAAIANHLTAIARSRSTLLVGRLLGLELPFGVFDEFQRLLGEPIHPAPEPGDQNQEHDQHGREEDNADCEYDR